MLRISEYLVFSPSGTSVSAIPPGAPCQHLRKGGGKTENWRWGGAVQCWLMDTMWPLQLMELLLSAQDMHGIKHMRSVQHYNRQYQLSSEEKEGDEKTWSRKGDMLEVPRRSWKCMWTRYIIYMYEIVKEYLKDTVKNWKTKRRLTCLVGSFFFLATWNMTDSITRRACGDAGSQRNTVSCFSPFIAAHSYKAGFLLELH